MDNTQIGLTGEFYVLAQLMQHGLVATLTLGNTKGVDILVSDSELNRLYKVEVNAHSTQAEHLFRRKPNTHSAGSRTPRSEATRLLF